MRICFIGDSFVHGTGDDDCQGWPGRLCAHARRHGHDITPYNLGVRRDTSADIATRWEREAASRLPAGQDGRLVFSFGVNDCVHEPAGQRRVPLEATIGNARAILSRARHLWPTLLVGPPCSGDPALDARIQPLSNMLFHVCKEVRMVPYLPLFELTQGDAVWRREAAQGDGIHPNREGYALVAEAVLNWPAWQKWV